MVVAGGGGGGGGGGVCVRVCMFHLCLANHCHNTHDFILSVAKVQGKHKECHTFVFPSFFFTYNFCNQFRMCVWAVCVFVAIPTHIYILLFLNFLFLFIFNLNFPSFQLLFHYQTYCYYCYYYYHLNIHSLNHKHLSFFVFCFFCFVI